MTRSASPLFRACVALRLPRGLYLDRGDLPLSDDLIRLALRRQHVATERLVLALADTIWDVTDTEDADDAWAIAATIAERRDLPSSLVGVLVVLAMLPEDGAVEPDELGFFCEAAP